jgi:hypothetical protein
MFVLNKKEALYHFDYRYTKLWDINFIEHPDLTGVFTPCHNFYYRQHTANPIVNKLIPISKHYEECENIFNVILPIIQKYMSWHIDSIESRIYKFNNHTLTNVFYEIESNGIKVDKQCFIDSYGANLNYPQFNLSKGRIYSQYNLYTQTGRPSNTYNSINFAALDKNNGERSCYRPTNDKFIEFDIQGYHPRILGDMIDFNFGDKNTDFTQKSYIFDLTLEQNRKLETEFVLPTLREVFQLLQRKVCINIEVKVPYDASVRAKYDWLRAIQTLNSLINSFALN